MRRMGAVAVALLLAPGLAHGQPTRFTVTQYIGVLLIVQNGLEQGQLDQAKGWAQNLRGAEIAFGEEAITADATVLEAVAAARTTAEGRLLAPRVRRLVAALKSAGTLPKAAGVRPDDLEALQGKGDAKKGGRVAAPRLQAPSFPQRVGDGIIAAYDWTVDKLRRLRDWLGKLRPQRANDPSGLGQTTVAAIAVVALAALGLCLLAWRTLRQARAVPTEVESDGAFHANLDDYPLSRVTTEWEARARELSAAGRWREAVRAFYHAVLVSLFEGGVLHYQKGRTNWEYAARLSPDLGWRPAFLDLTRLFDREWYGRTTGDPAAARAAAEAARSILRSVRAAGETA